MAIDKDQKSRSAQTQERLKGFFERLKAELTLWRVLSYVVVVGIFDTVIQGEVSMGWTTWLRPWLATSTQIGQGWLVLAFAGWLAALIFFWNGRIDRRSSEVKRFLQEENDRLKENIALLNNNIGELNSKAIDYKVLKAELEKLSKQAKLLDLIFHVDRELILLLVSKEVFDEDTSSRFAISFLRRISELFGNFTVRACVYIPDPADPDVLIILWSQGVGDDSRRFNHWYIGNGDPAATGKRRGIPGSVWIKGEGRVQEHVKDDPDFYDPHVPKREFLPYESILQTVIYPDGEQEKLGILSLDSKEYTFTQYDLDLVTQAATRLGWYLWARELRSRDIGREAGQEGVDHNER